MLHSLFMCIMMISLYFIRLTHPVSMGLVLILHTLIVGLVTGMVADNFFYSYILFLVILGGVLVLFIYMTSLVSNEMFKFTWWDTLTVGSMMMLLGVSMVVPYTPAPSGLISAETPLAMVWSDLEVGVMKLYSEGSYFLTLFLVGYLLFVLLVCVKVVENKAGALRKFN